MRLDPTRSMYTSARAAAAAVVPIAVVTFAVVTFAATALAPHAAAQARPSPAHFARAEGPTSDTAVIGDTQPFGRLLQVHDDLNGANGTIQSLGFRLDDGVSAPAFTILVDVWCSTARTQAAQPHAQFDQNHGTDKARAVAFKMVHFPAAQRRIPFVDNFTHVIPFDTPFVFAGQGPLCWEVLLHGTTKLSPVQLDAVAGSDDSPMPVQAQVSHGCRTAGTSYASPFRLVCTPTLDWKQLSLDVALDGSGGPPSQLAVLMAGLRYHSFGGVPLPFEIPGSPTAPSGACRVHVAPELTLATLMKSDGSLPLVLRSFLGPYVLGVDLGFQLLARDSGANPWGVVTSDTVGLRFLTPYPLQPVGQVIAGSHAATGAAQPNTGLITAVQY